MKKENLPQSAINKLLDCICGLKQTCREVSTGVEPEFIDELIITLPYRPKKKYIPSDFIKMAKALYPILDQYRDALFKVDICDCSHNVAVVNFGNSQEIIGHIQNSPLESQGVKQGGDANYIADLEKVILPNKGKQSKISNDPDGSFANVFILDTGIKTNSLSTLIHSNLPIDINSIRVIPSGCNENEKISDPHGTAVAYCLLEELCMNQPKGLKGVNIYSYNVGRLYKGKIVIPQFNVICALSNVLQNKAFKAKKPSYLNMSFGFELELPLVADLLNEYLVKDKKIITCSAGNFQRDLTYGAGHVNYPSAYARSSKVTGLIYEVFGNMEEVSKNRRTQVPWAVRTSTGVGTNFTTPRNHGKSHHENAVWNNDKNREGGTSFSSPRALAKIIKDMYA